MLEPNEHDPEAEMDLVRRVMASEDRAITEFAEKLRIVPRVLAAENRRRGRPLDDNDLADLAQDTSLVVLRKLGEFVGSTPLDAWIQKVAKLEFMNGLRRTWRFRSRTAKDPEATERIESERSGDWLAKESVLGALDQLDADEAEVVRLKHFSGLTFAEMAERLECPTNSCKTRYYRGLSRLETLLGEWRDDYR